MRRRDYKAERFDTLRHVQRNPGCTCRDVTVHVFGGDGRTRTTPRGHAWGALVWLERNGFLRREKPAEYTSGHGDRWFPMEVPKT